MSTWGCGQHSAQNNFFVKSGEDKTIQESQEPLDKMQRAIFDGDYLAVQNLISEEYPIDSILKNDRTALAEACLQRQSRIIRILINSKARIDLSPIEGVDLLTWVEEQTDAKKILRALLKTEIEDQLEFLEVLTKNNFSEIKSLLGEEINVNFISAEGETPLILSIRNRWNNSLRVLFAEPILDVNFKNSKGETPLKVARDLKLVQIEKELLRRNASEE